MICLEEDLKNINGNTPAVVTLGKFDGLHRGHQSLIRRTVALAGELKAEPCAFIMDNTDKGLLTRRERLDFLEKLGITRVIELPLTPHFMNQEPEDFIHGILCDRLKAKAVVVGENYRFGRKRRGDAFLLKSEMEKDGLCADILPILTDQGERISSSLVREYLFSGNMERVNEILGYRFSVAGEIIHGRRLGRTLDTPTTNIIPDPSKLLPPNGVYASCVMVEGACYRGMTNIGIKPTVKGSTLGIETYLFDCHEDLYGKKQQIFLLHHTRPERNFGSVLALSEQLERDKEETASFLKDVLDDG